MFKSIIKKVGVIGCTTGLLLPGMGVANAATQAPTGQANSTIFGPNVYVFDPSMSASDI